MDTGFDLKHPDLKPNIDFNSLYDFTGEGIQFNPAEGFSHGTHTAGTIAAADNGFGTIGVAPKAKLVLIKVLEDNGSGYLSWALNGIIHATHEGCDVINMSLGGYINKSNDNLPANGTAALLSAFNRVCNYANQNGTTVIAAAGNDAIDFDHVANWVQLPSDATNVINISATGPRGWAYDMSTNLDVFASYSNFGQSFIDFAAPGGDYTLHPIDGWSWSSGTSMAAPHATGVAALIIGKNGGDMAPAKVKSMQRASADNLGKPGRDDF